IVAQREQVAAGAARLADRRMKLASAIATKSSQQEQVSARSQELTMEVGRLAREAEDLRALFAKLAEEKAKREAEGGKAADARKAEEEAKAQAKAEPASPKSEARPQERIVLKAPLGITPESGPPRPITQAKGTLPFPAVGRITAQYGEN